MSTLVITPPLPDLELVFVQGGEFMMGDDNGEYDDEKPAHLVRLDDFYIGKYPVTQRLWQAVMENNPSRFKGERRPVEQVSWDDAQEFLGRLNRLTGKNFRLPTEAEWEYAARGGKYSQGCKYAGSDRAKQVAWHDANSGGETHEVGLLLPNELGLYDMSGNVWEWCADWFSEEYYFECHQLGIAENPQGPESGSSRVIRGGSWNYCLGTCGRRTATGARRSSATASWASGSSSQVSKVRQAGEGRREARPSGPCGSRAGTSRSLRSAAKVLHTEGIHQRCGK